MALRAFPSIIFTTSNIATRTSPMPLRKQNGRNHRIERQCPSDRDYRMIAPGVLIEADDDDLMFIKVPDVMGVVERVPTKKKVA
jgi:hypothetical protein